MSDFSHFPSPRQINFFVRENLTQDLHLQAFLFCSFSSSSDFLNILPVGLFYYDTWDFSKGFHIFVRGVYLKTRKENNTAYPGKIP